MENWSIKLKWIQGFCSGTPGYLSTDRLFVPCDNILKSSSIDGKCQNSYATPGIGIGCATTCPELGIVAISEQSQHPIIHILRFPNLEVLSELQDGASEEYLALAFVGLDYLVSVGRPKDHVITTWKWSSGEKLYTLPQMWQESKSLHVELSVNPSSWYQLCLQENFCLTFLEIKNCGEDFKLASKRFTLNKVPDGLRFVELSSEVVDDDEDNETETRTKRLKPLCHCWLPRDDLLLACTDGSVVKVSIDGPDFSIKCRVVNNVKAITSMALNKTGLFVAKKDGFIEVFDLRMDRWVLLEKVNIGQSIRHLLFAPDYQSLAITTFKGSVFIYNASNNCEKNKKLTLILGGELSEVVSICILGSNSRYCVTAKSNGLIQTWDMYDGEFVNSLNIGEVIVKMISGLVSSVVIVGAASGFAYFVDMINSSSPRILQVEKKFDLPVKHICIDNYGRYVGMAAKSNSLHLFSGLPSSNFYELGYHTISGNVKDLKLFSMTEKECTVVLLIVENKLNDSLVKLTLPLDLLHDPKKYQIDDFGSLTKECLNCQQWSLTHQASKLEAHSTLGAIFYSQTVEKIQRIQVWDESQSAEPLDITHNNAVCSLKVSPNQSWLACMDIYGSFHMYFAFHPAVTLAMEVSDKCKKIRHSLFDFSMFGKTMVIAKEKGTIMCYEYTETPETQKAMESIVFCKIGGEKENKYLRCMKEDTIEDGVQEVHTVKKNSSHILKEMDEDFEHCLDVFSFKLSRLSAEFEDLPDTCSKHFTLDKDTFPGFFKKNDKKICSMISLIPGSLALECFPRNSSFVNEGDESLSSLCLKISFTNYTMRDAALEALETILQNNEKSSSGNTPRKANSETCVVSMSRISIPNHDVLEQVRQIRKDMQYMKRTFNLKFKSLQYEKNIVTRSISESYIRMKDSSDCLPSKAERDFWSTMIESDMGQLVLSDIESIGKFSAMENSGNGNTSGEQAKRTISSLSENIVSATKNFDSDIEKLYEEKLYCDFVLHKEELRVFILLLSSSFGHFVNQWQRNYKLALKFLTDCEKNICTLISEVKQLGKETKLLYVEIQKLERENNLKAEAILQKYDSNESLVKFFRQRPVVELDPGCCVNPFWCHPLVLTKRCLSLNSKSSETDVSTGKDSNAWKKISRKKAYRDNFNLIIRYLQSQASDLTRTRQQCEDFFHVLSMERTRCDETELKVTAVSSEFAENTKSLLSDHLQAHDPIPEPGQTIVPDDTLEQRHNFRSSVRTKSFLNQVLQERLEDLERTFENLRQVRAGAESRRTNQNRKFLNTKYGLNEDVTTIRERILTCKAIAEEFIETRRKSVFRFFTHTSKETNDNP